MILALLISFASFGAIDPQALSVVTRAVGQVGDSAITSRQVILSGLIEQWTLALQDRPKATIPKEEKLKWILNLDTEEFRTQLTRMMIDWIVSLEAENLNVADIEFGELQLRQTRFLIEMAALPEWKGLGYSQAEVTAALRRKLRSRAFLQFKIETSGILVTDDEAKEYYDKNRAKFGNYGFSQFKGSIKEALTQQKLESRLKDWFEILKKKYRVRYLSAPVAPPK